MKNKRYQTLIFDMDGTLINSDPMIVEAFNILYDTYNNGKRKTKEEIYKFSGPPIRETLANEFPHMDPDFMVNKFREISKPLYQSHVFLFEKEKEVLEEFAKEEFTLAIMTNKKHSFTILALEVLDIKKYFDVIIAYDDVTNGKPDPEGILKVIELTSSKKESSIYIGDNVVDFMSAENAGIDCALVAFGPRNIPSEIKPKWRFTSYEDLRKVVYE